MKTTQKKTVTKIQVAAETKAEEDAYQPSNGDDIDVEALLKEIQSLQVPVEEEPEERKTFPKKNPALLAAVSATPSTEQELLSYLKRINGLVSSNMPAASLQQVKKAIDSCYGNAVTMGATSITAWYNSAYQEALVIATEACLNNPKNHLLLNNLAALLNLSGGEYKALPILRMLVNQHPANSMVLNNIGQAYTGMGELDSAMMYFARCIKEVPNHPEANNTAGEIEASKGNTEKAEAHFEKSVNGAITSSTLKRLERLSKSRNSFSNYVSRHVRPRIKLPDIFNAYKYQPIRQIRNVDDAKTIEEEHMQFEEFMHNVLDMYGELSQKEDDKGHDLHEKNIRIITKDPLKYAEDMGRYISPFATPASVVYARLAHSYRLRKEDMAQYRIEREKEIYDLQVAMDEQMAKNVREDYAKCLEETTCKNCNPEEICNKRVLYPLNNKAANEFLAKAADIREDIQRKELALARETYENLAYFGYLAGANKHMAKANFYKACYDYAAAILQANETAFVAKAGEEGETLNPKPGGSDVPADMACPINVKFNWGVAKVEISCEKFKIGAFGGMIKGSKNRKTKQSTLQLGVDLSKDFEKDMGGVKGTVKVGMEESIFLTFDEHNSLVDGGLAFEAKASATLSTSVETGNGTIPKVDGAGKAEAGFGYTLGVNSGWTFTEGALAPLLEKIKW